MELSTFSIRLFVAILAGALIGIERQWHHKSAGLRTNALVALGAAVYILISLSLVDQGGEPTRIISQVVTGVGFLGAGVILHQGADVQGLTTAATIWCSAAVGCLAGLGYYEETLVATLMIIFVNAVFIKVDAIINSRRN